MSQIRNEAVGLQAGALALLTSVLWGGNPVAIKMGLDGVPPAAMEPALSRALYPLFIMIGAAMTPSMVTAAPTIPVAAANNVATARTTM